MAEARTTLEGSEDHRGNRGAVRPTAPVSLDATTKGIAAALGAKLYGDRSKLDALVYVDLETRYIFRPLTDIRFEAPGELVMQGWRSVTMLFLPYAAVLTASADAPDFLRERAGRLYIETDARILEGLFED